MNRIHPTAIIDSTVELGSDNTIGPFTVILGNCTIGDNNHISSHVAIGSPSEIRDAPHVATWAGDVESGTVKIGNNNVLREFVTIHSGFITGTIIENNCYVMNKAHVPHDSQLQEGVTVSAGAMIGGHSIIQTRANIGLGAVIHQKLVIGSGSMIGMGSVVTKHVPPFALCYGNPSRVRGGNLVGMTRYGFDISVSELISEHLLNNSYDKLRNLIPSEMLHFESSCKKLSK
jgi:UDP-N-acetylglucosamine acyltransferase